MKKIKTMLILISLFVMPKTYSSQSSNSWNIQIGLGGATIGCAAMAVKNILAYNNGSLLSFGNTTVIATDNQGRLAITQNGERVRPQQSSDGTLNYRSRTNSIFCRSDVTIRSGRNNSLANSVSQSQDSDFLDKISEKSNNSKSNRYIWSAIGWTALTAAAGAAWFYAAHKKK